MTTRQVVSDRNAWKEGDGVANPSRQWAWLAVVCTTLFCCTAASSKTPLGQFDLICPTFSRIVKADNPDLVGYVSYSGPPSYYSVQRFSFDLKRDVYRSPGWQDGVFETIRIERGPVLVAKNGDGYSRFDLRTNRYFSRQMASARSDEIETAHCRRVPFSGFGNIAPKKERQPR